MIHVNLERVDTFQRFCFLANDGRQEEIRSPNGQKWWTVETYL